MLNKTQVTLHKLALSVNWVLKDYESQRRNGYRIPI